MSWSLNAAAPIYQQIEEKIKNDIISGKYLPGQKLPGVRDLAMDASVNPNTMQRALTDLERDGFVITLGTNGRVVTSDLDLIKKEKETQFCSITRAYIEKIKSLGFAGREAADMILQLEEEI
ncbi:MAG: GntR family transcriptional regulator [Clostridia bacterium]